MTQKTTTQATKRECGDCAMCCKVMKIPDMDSPAGEWCRQCKPGHKACQIYSTRPTGCAEFSCAWLSNEMPEWFKPSKCKCVIAASTAGWILCYVDPGYPNAWREGKMSHWIALMAKRHPMVIISGSLRRIIAASNEARGKAKGIMDRANLEAHERPEIATSMREAIHPRRPS